MSLAFVVPELGAAVAPRASRVAAGRLRGSSQPAASASRGGPVAAAAVAAAVAATRSTAGGRQPRRRRQARVRRRAEEDFDYGTPEYWDNRYKEDGVEKTYDWLGGYDKFQEYIERAAARVEGDRKELRVLDLGCGNAALAEAMYDDGYTNITAVDISPTVIDAMRERNAEKRPGITWVTGDAFSLEMEDESFDVVIDKSTMDAISCDADHINENLCRLMSEVSRVLATGGTYLLFSSTDSTGRKALTFPTLAYTVEETNIGMAFASLHAFEAVKQVGANSARLLKGQPFLDFCIESDRQIVEARRQRQEADERLKAQAPSNFGVLD